MRESWGAVGEASHPLRSSLTQSDEVTFRCYCHRQNPNSSLLPTHSCRKQPASRKTCPLFEFDEKLPCSPTALALTHANAANAYSPAPSSASPASSVSPPSGIVVLLKVQCPET